MNSSHKILVVDDEPPVAEAHAQILSDIGFPTVVLTDPGYALEEISHHPDIDVVLLDIQMPGMNGLELLNRIKLVRPELGVIMVTVINDVDLAVQAIKSGAYNYLLKPLQLERVKGVLSSFCDNRPRRFLDDPRFSPYITGCPRFEPIFRAVKAFAEADVTILVQGETGTGKELIARMIHSLSTRKTDRFAVLDVAAIPSGLFESELFGHRKGAFTSATSDHQGHFEAAGSGTLFIDEIGELANELQVKLLRAVQTRKFARVGETSEKEMNARLVLATNRDIAVEMKANRFRSDLYYRLASHTITLPPLRDRGGDVPILADYLLRKYCSQFGRQIAGFLPETMDILNSYPFPGNIRELEGIVSSAVLLEQGLAISPESLPRHVRETEKPEGDDLEAIRIRAIRDALASCNGNQTKAALKLGVSRGHLNTLLKRLRERGQLQ